MHVMHHILGRGDGMKTLTLRNVPPHVATAISRRARERGTSLTKAVISLLEDGLGTRQGVGPRYHDLDDLAGSWAREEAATFEEALREQRAIDQDVWR